MDIDFSIKKKEQVNSGLVMELIPALTDEDLLVNESVFVHEDAFFYVEPFIEKGWPAYGDPYAHWGKSKIPVDAWKEIVSLLSKLRESLIVAGSAADVYGVEIFFEGVKEDFFKDFNVVRDLLAEMLGKLISWLESNFGVCQYIYIVGI